MSIEINRDPFSPHHGQAHCTDCKQRVWSQEHRCPTMCPVCGTQTWGAALHQRCCDHPAGSLVPWDQLDIRRARNGQRNYYRRCQDCDKNLGIKHCDVPEWATRATPGIDNTDDEHPCARCDDRLTEYHHFAPGAIFADSDLWPGAWLCKACHGLWHAAMRDSAGYRLDTKRYCDWANDDKPYSQRWNIATAAWEAS